MAQPTFAQASDPNTTTGGFSQEQIMQRMVSLLAVLVSGQNPDGTANNGAGAGPPSGSTGVSDSHASAASANTCTLTGASGKFTYLEGLYVTGNGATGATTVAVAVSGTNATPSFTLSIPASASTAITPNPLFVQFNPPLRSTAVNTNIVVTVPSFGSGNTFASASAWGYTA